MRLTKEQWNILDPLLPKARKRSDGKGRPPRPNKEVLEGILWVLKTGARWRDLPEGYPPYQTCHRRFQQWIRGGVLRSILRALINHLKHKRKIDLTETFIDASFVKAKKGAKKSAKQKQEKAPRSWPSRMETLFLSPYVFRVLHHMRVDLLRERFGPAIVDTFLSDLWVTKLTIATFSIESLKEDIELNSLLPISEIESLQQLKMEELYEDIGSDGLWSDSLPGSNPFVEPKQDMKSSLLTF